MKDVNFVVLNSNILKANECAIFVKFYKVSQSVAVEVGFFKDLWRYNQDFAISIFKLNKCYCIPTLEIE